MRKNFVLLTILVILFVGCSALNPLPEGFKTVNEKGEGSPVYDNSVVLALTPPRNITVDTESSLYPKLKWTPNPDAKAYRIFRSTSEDGDFVVVENGEDVNTDSFIDSSIVFKTGSITYYYKIASVNYSGKLGYASNAYSATLDIEAYDKKVAIVDVSKGNYEEVGEYTYLNNKAGIRVRWEPTDGAISYKILRAKQNGSVIPSIDNAEVIEPDFLSISTVTYATDGELHTYIDDNVEKAGAFYHYWIVAKNNLGLEGVPSDSQYGYIFKTGELTFVSKGFVGDGKETEKVQIDWTFSKGSVPEDADEFILYRTTNLKDPDSWQSITIDNTSSVSYIDFKADFPDPDHLFDDKKVVPVYYQIAVKYGEIESLKSNLAAGYIADGSVSSLPFLDVDDITVTNGSITDDTRIKLSWEKPSDAAVEKYVIMRADDYNALDDNWTEVGTIEIDGSTPDTIEWIDNDAESAGTYFYKVNPGNAVTVLPNDHIVSGYVIPAVVTDLSATVRSFDDKIELTWTDVDADFYLIEAKNSLVNGGNYFTVKTSFIPTTNDITYSFTGLNDVFEIGYYTFKVTPSVSKVLNGYPSTMPNSNNSFGPVSDEVDGAREITDKEWVKAAVYEISELQSLYPLKNESSGTNHKKDFEGFSIESYRYRYSSDKFDIYNFKKLGVSDGATKNGSFFLTGAVIYGKMNNWSERLNVMYTMNGDISEYKWDMDKSQGIIQVKGLYPGELFIFALMAGEGVGGVSGKTYNSDTGSYPVGDVASNLANETCSDGYSDEDWVLTYNFDLSRSVSSFDANIDNSSAYAYKREKNGVLDEIYSNLTFDEVGAIR